MWEAMVDETRAVEADLAARAVFASDGDVVKDTRTELAERIAAEFAAPEPAAARAVRSAAYLSHAADSGFIEVG